LALAVLEEARLVTGLRQIVEAATPGPWDTYAVGSEGFGVFGQRGARRHRITLVGHGAWEDVKVDARLIALAPELASLCLEMGDLLRLPVDEIQEGDAEDVLARLDQLGKEQT
jgi:hypothetical protein